jgi:hypothetical protein
LQRSLCGTAPDFSGAHGRDVRIADRPNVRKSESNEGLRLTGEADKLDIKRGAIIQVYHRAQITAAQPVLWEVAFKDDGIEFVQAHDALAG